MQSLKQNLKIIILALIIAVGANYVYAWTGPTQTAPAGNTAAPLNVGTIDQVKNAGLSLNKLLVSGQVKIADGTQGAGKVLTSDAAGTASWLTPSGVTKVILDPTNTIFDHLGSSGSVPGTGDVTLYATGQSACTALGGTWDAVTKCTLPSGSSGLGANMIVCSRAGSAISTNVGALPFISFSSADCGGATLTSAYHGMLKRVRWSGGANNVEVLDVGEASSWGATGPGVHLNCEGGCAVTATNNVTVVYIKK